MVAKLTSYHDLFAYDAQYHKSCYCSYISSKNIQAALKKDSVKQPKSERNPSPSRISESSNTTDSDSPNATKSSIVSDSEMDILHKAAGIIRKEMLKIDNKPEKVPHPSELNFSTFDSEVPQLLSLFISWLLDGQRYAIIISNLIMGLFDTVYKQNSFHIGLGLHIYHITHSKQIMELLSSLGFMCSYNYARAITTSMAKETINCGTYVYVPPGFERVDPIKNNYIHASM
ncbi:hypothetical protein RI129_003103 [Pyrocoelia pectoralis]|uniref:Uncharacterized protein n=1 Tax=Pyrocoelia pectoralis TaxID=417401 RepID=A0AAN7VNW7_9COLE